MTRESLRQVRLDKIQKLRDAGVHPYPERFDRTHTLEEAKSLPEATAGVRLAGRLVSVNKIGKLTFAWLQDIRGRLQIALRKNEIGEEEYTLFHQTIDLGDFIGVEGEIFTTRTGELTLQSAAWTFLGKAIRPMPEKWHGLQDTEACYRQRYLDMIASEESRKRFIMRGQVIRSMRSHLDQHGFDEVDTPVLCEKPSGALARPFMTHHNALDIEIPLRIAPETYLKRCIVAGYDRVYEFARCFRNEGMDPSHLQDFTMLEYYVAYWNFEDNMAFTERMLYETVTAVLGSPVIERDGQQISFEPPWPRRSMAELIQESCGIDIAAFEDPDALRAEIAQRGIALGQEEIANLALGNLIDQLYKKVARPGLVQPTFLVHHPIQLSPLARCNDQNPAITDRFQLVVCGWELINAYSELVDPIDQRARLEAQQLARAAGDHEAMPLDEDYLLTMEYGMPPISGWGMGVDRFVAMLAGVPNLRDVVLFPLMRPRPVSEYSGEDADPDGPQEAKSE